MPLCSATHLSVFFMETASLLKFRIDAAVRLCGGCIEQNKELDFNLQNKSQKVKEGGGGVENERASFSPQEDQCGVREEEKNYEQHEKQRWDDAAWKMRALPRGCVNPSSWAFFHLI